MTDIIGTTIAQQVSTVLIAQNAGPTWLKPILESPRPTEIFAIFCATLMFLVPFVAFAWYKLRVRQWEIALKQAMVERGMSAEEICDVVAAGSAKMSREGLQVRVRR